ncbi:Na-translocating system protein MpsC family protein [Saccharibacillus sp. CPCC 101409]|uniref:Na-translocating system protein MpsC family protein n=1 Tax=Saccharibacillus sp. CPCC 101409 TaxID=3058041 RepID=UPI0026732783|nr:Na-translocating system protein MpsC family protein [Saccharibacillus sp. CPCC 101409]MDO3408184.1 Na-translocating system protein MpsC family protein [Saccharibacillus sp. CPCC 101409]
MSDKDKAVKIAEGIDKLLRTRFGKAPDSLNLSMDSDCLVIHMKGFVHPFEAALLAEQSEKTFRYTRELMMKAFVPDLTLLLDEENLNAESFYYDWSADDASGTIVALFRSEPCHRQTYIGREELHVRLDAALSRSHKVPSYIDSWWVDPRTLVIFRKGIFGLLEKELYDLDYEDILKTAKRRLEKRTIKQNLDIGRYVRRRMSEIYVDWNFGKSDSVLVCRFDSAQKTEAGRSIE